MFDEKFVFNFLPELALNQFHHNWAKAGSCPFIGEMVTVPFFNLLFVYLLVVHRRP